MDYKTMKDKMDRKSIAFDKAAELQDAIDCIKSGNICVLSVGKYDYEFDEKDGQYCIENSDFRATLISAIKAVQDEYIKKFKSIRLEE